MGCYQTTTVNNYLAIWRSFNKFLVRLDKRAKFWENKVTLFCTYLINRGSQASTVKSYISGIKAILKQDGYKWKEDCELLSTLTHACQIKNDKLRSRLPIGRKLLEMLIFELNHIWDTQPFLEAMYKAIFCLAYFGLMRIGELTQGDHPVKAKDVHIGTNKDKIMVILYSSRTHSKANYPQQIKISVSTAGDNKRKSYTGSNSFSALSQ